jgi:short-subunit dehydrogenase
MFRYVLLTLLLIFGLWLILAPFLEKTVSINDSTRVCLVTGVSSGIGLEIAKKMVKKGWRVIGIARRQNKLDSITKLLGDRNFIPFACDVSLSDQVHKISEEIRTKGLKPTLFFLNAGAGEIESLYKISLEKHRKFFNVNYFGVVGWVEEWLSQVKNYGGGTFVATSSITSLFAPPGSAAYSASKAAVNLCFQAWRLQYLNENIGFSLVLPGPIDTEMLKSGASLPFVQKPDETADYIVEEIFKGAKYIYPSWFYSVILRLIGFLPDRVLLKLLSYSESSLPQRTLTVTP